MKFRVEIFVSPRKDILDPQGKAIENALSNIGYSGVSDVRIGKYLTFELFSESAETARAAVDEMCRKLLANPVVENYRISVADA